MTLAEFFKSEKIYEYSIIAFDKVVVTNKAKAERLFEKKDCLTVVPFLIPYLVRSNGKSNISLYAHSMDYHHYFKQLSARASAVFGDVISACDASPINEVACAVESGLGDIGKNGLLLNRRYGTYAFVGEFFFSLPKTDEIFAGISKRDKGHLCHECGACERACPTSALFDKTRCISFINQKKKLDDGDEELIKRSGSAWGCDICQEVCPYNKNAEESEIEFFKEERTPYLTEDMIDKMILDNTFDLRAYAWRGESVIRRNLKLCQNQTNAKQ